MYLLSRRYLLLIACLCSVTAGAGAQVIHDVDQIDMAFSPASVTVNVGDSVRWNWSSREHTVTSGTPCTPDGLFDAPLNATQPQFVHQFNTPGIHPYFCTFHCFMDMTGTVTVLAPVCQPRPDGQGCAQVACPNPTVEQCRPKCAHVSGGVVTVSECDCVNPNQCHLERDATGQPQCFGDCPVGTHCESTIVPTPDGYDICCNCVTDPPPQCGPRPDGQGCLPTTCPTPPGGECRPKCVRQDAAGGYVVVDCQCVGPEECHLEFDSGPTCIIPDNGAGTADLPPVGCTYTTPSGDMQIINGLPPGTTIQIDASKGNFVCPGGLSICAFTPGAACAYPGGSLGGMMSCADTGLVMPMVGTGTLAGFNRNITLPVSLEIHTAPRVNYSSPQSFDAVVARLFGQIFGDPDFDLLRISAGNDFGLPSPGHTTLTQLGGNWAVDSFFDITYRIDFVGKPGGALQGLSGSTTGTVRFVTGNPAPVCVGPCPTGTHCELTQTVLPDGTVGLCCNCVPDEPMVCEPRPDGQGCKQVTCPNPTVEQCRPTCAHVAGGVITVSTCDCINPNQCHVELVAGAPPQCAGDCPVGTHCEKSIVPTPDGYDMCCTCVADPPPQCGPRPDGQGCLPTTCPTPPGGECRPKCVRQDAAGGYVVVDCQCVGPEECHLEFDYGTTCVVPDNGTGTADLPPVGCIYTTPQGDMHIIDGLPVGDTIDIDASQSNFVCPGGASVCSFMAGPGCAQPGGSLGGMKSCADGSLSMPMQGTGSLSTFSRNIVLPFGLEIHTAPRVNGNPFQSFNTGLFRMFGQITGDPDFDLLRVVAGTDFGMPSPGHTTLTQTGGNWTVDSFFDITYRIDFVGTTGGSLSGRSGSTTGTVRFWTSTTIPTPVCVGTCPPGMHCELTQTILPDGTVGLCCACVPDQPQECGPTSDGHACLPVQCPDATQECLPSCVLVDFQGLMTVEDCTCRSPDTCHIEMVPGALPTCVGQCPPGQTCIQRVIPTPTGTRYCCECVNDPPECAPTPDGQACLPYLCPVPPTNHECRPRCIRSNLATGQTWIIDCECQGPSECKPFWQPGMVPFCEGNCPPGYKCIENRITNPDGTEDLCCDCIQEFCRCPGDINGDGLVNGLDIQGFVNCILGISQPADNCACADMNGDGFVDMLDVPLFVTRLLTCLPCEPIPCPPQDLFIDLTTGVDGAGGFIPVGSDDDTWTVTVDASGGSVPRPATVINPHPVWLTIPGSQWISANYYGPNGDYEYEICFCLDERFSNPVLSLQVRTDDTGDVYLNGNFIGAAASFATPSPASITVTNPASFLIGRNCVTVVVHNIGGPPTGLDLAGTFRATNGKCCCDEADLDESIDTGVDDTNGSLIPVGTDDDTWEVTVDPSGGTVPRPATVINPHPAWLTIPGTQWISAAQTGPNGSYTYRYCFCLDPRFQNAQLVLDLRADDAASVYLNGSFVGATPFGWAFNTPLPTHVFVSNQSLFKPGENCIEIVVINGGGVVTGLNLAGRITADHGRCCSDRVGACCFRGGACQVLSEQECFAAGGSPLGVGTVCLGDADGNGIDDACQPPPPYSCCLENGLCVDLAPGTTQCPSGGLLISGPCGASQACCMPDGTCRDTSEVCCRETGGTPRGPGSSCATFLCQLPQEYSCCLPDGLCVDLAPGWTQCPSGGTLILGPCGISQACCLPDGTCRDVAEACCHLLGGTPKGLGTLCATAGCQPPQEYSCCFADGRCVDLAPGSQCLFGSTQVLGPCGVEQACCLPDGTCRDLAAACCNVLGGTPKGLGTLCIGVSCPQPPVCGPDPLAPLQCRQTTCPTPGETCQPRCVLVEEGTYIVLSVLECDCRQAGGECAAGISPAPSVFTGCTGGCPVTSPFCVASMTHHGNGTMTICCDCSAVPPG